MLNVYAEMNPIVAIKTVAGNTALGALPNAAMPAGIARTPPPTIVLTRLKISFGIVAVPVPLLVPPTKLPPLPSSESLSKEFDADERLVTNTLPLSPSAVVRIGRLRLIVDDDVFACGQAARAGVKLSALPTQRHATNTIIHITRTLRIRAVRDIFLYRNALRRRVVLMDGRGGRQWM